MIIIKALGRCLLLPALCILCGNNAIANPEIITSDYTSAIDTTEQVLLHDSTDSPSPLVTPNGQTTFEEHGGYAIVEGDILIGRSADLLTIKTRNQFRGLSRNSKLDRWVDGLVYYAIDSGLPAPEQGRINAAIEHWNANSTITLIERTAELVPTVNDYINFESFNGCASWVGKIGGPQSLWVAANCSVGSIIHEIGHAVGFFHEHTRDDRDNFITIVEDNILEGKEINFAVVTDGVSPIGEYDYGSIMHYGPNFFSKNGLATIIPLQGDLSSTIGQRDGLSIIDKDSINQMYGTDLALSSDITTNADSSKTITNIVTNNGNAGAHDLTYSVELPTGTSFFSANEDDWACQIANSLLTCNLWVLPEAAVSTFRVSLSSADDDIISTANLSSKTFDNDLSNNGQELLSTPDSELKTGEANPGDNSAPTITASGGSGGGAASWFFLWVIAFIRYRPFTRKDNMDL